GRGAERLDRRGFALLGHEQGGLLGRREIAPMAQPPLGGDEPGRAGDPIEQRGVDRLAGDHSPKTLRAAASRPARISGLISARRERRGSPHPIAALTSLPRFAPTLPSPARGGGLRRGRRRVGVGAKAGGTPAVRIAAVTVSAVVSML